MTAAMGLALTGALLVFAALVIAFAADSTKHYSAERRLAVIGWVVFTAGVLALIASIWVEVAS